MPTEPPDPSLPNTLTIESHDALSDKLRGLRVTVPPRGLGKRPPSDEWWIVARLLLAVLDRVEFPLDIVKGESPDFVLRGNDRYAGVEVTEASSRAFNQAQGNANRAGLEGGIDPGLHRWQDESQTPPKLRKRGKRHEGRPISFGWNRDEAETEWARCVRARIDDKVALLSSSTTYTRFDMNWLVVYDNLQVPEPKLDRALALLGTDIGEFDAVFVLTGGTLIVIERGATRRLPAPSL